MRLWEGKGREGDRRMTERGFLGIGGCRVGVETLGSTRPAIHHHHLLMTDMGLQPAGASLYVAVHTLHYRDLYSLRQESESDVNKIWNTMKLLNYSLYLGGYQNRS